MPYLGKNMQKTPKQNTHCNLVIFILKTHCCRKHAALICQTASAKNILCFFLCVISQQWSATISLCFCFTYMKESLLNTCDLHSKEFFPLRINLRQEMYSSLQYGVVFWGLTVCIKPTVFPTGIFNVNDLFLSGKKEVCYFPYATCGVLV